MQATSVRKTGGEPLPREFEALFEEHYDLIYRTAYAVTGRVEDAEDAVQTIFLRLLRRHQPRDFLKHPRSYLYKSAVNVSLKILETRRHRARTETSDELAASVPARVSSRSEELHRNLYDAIGRLKPKAASILLFRYLHNY